MSTQIVQRDRHAAFLAAIAILGGSLERLATEVRNLQHTEIAEVMEPFKRGQKGSSAMPHKRNPILSERIAGLARLLRGYAQTAFENQPLWHERDISHSSRRARDPARRDDPARLHAREDDGPGRGAGGPAGADAREHRARASGSTPRPACCSPWSRRPACRARTPTPSSSATPCGRPTSGSRSTACWPPTPPWPRRLPLADLDACFDDAAVLRHVPEIIARLDALERGGRRPQGGSDAAG